jgi:hypothetical protein
MNPQSFARGWQSKQGVFAHSICLRVRIVGQSRFEENALVGAIEAAQSNGLPEPEPANILQMCQAPAAKQYMYEALHCALDGDSRITMMLDKAKTAARGAQFPELET